MAQEYSLIVEMHRSSGRAQIFSVPLPRPDSLHVQLGHSGIVHFEGTIRKTLVITNFTQTLKSPPSPS